MKPRPQIAGRTLMPPLRIGMCIDLVWILLSAQGMRFLWNLCVP
jgi:hypothetical protein